MGLLKYLSKLKNGWALFIVMASIRINNGTTITFNPMISEKFSLGTNVNILLMIENAVPIESDLKKIHDIRTRLKLYQSINTLGTRVM